MDESKIKILCYGASVTAQKGEAGYVQQLKELLDKKAYNIDKIGRGASHFEYAGFGFASEIANHAPDILIVDWLTPSMVAFSEYKIDKFNKCFSEQGIEVIWVNFPRKDDLDNQRKCFTQVKQSCQRFNIDFLDFNDLVVGDPDKFLRDVVHTTELGAREYASALCGHITTIKKSPMPKKVDVCSLPNILEVSSTVNTKEPLVLELDGFHKKVDILLECFIGPNSPLLKFSSKQSAREEVNLVEKVVNPIDAWCYYTRRMVLPTVTLTSEAPFNHIVISAIEGEPLDSVNLNKEITEEISNQKYIQLVNIVVDYKD